MGVWSPCGLEACAGLIIRCTRCACEEAETEVRANVEAVLELRMLIVIPLYGRATIIDMTDCEDVESAGRSVNSVGGRIHATSWTVCSKTQHSKEKGDAYLLARAALMLRKRRILQRDARIQVPDSQRCHIRM